MNKQKAPGGIEWTRVWGRDGYTANPVKGCLHGCEWEMPDGSRAICYAKSVAESIARDAYPYGFEKIQYNGGDLQAIANLKKPAGIFMDSMSDLFGVGVNQDEIEKVLAVLRDNPRHVYFTLTKNHPRLTRFSTTMPRSVWAGVSMPPTYMQGDRIPEHNQIRWFDRALRNLSTVDVPIRWVSLEPLSWDCSEVLVDHASSLSWAVIGAASNGRQFFQPDRGTFERVMDVLTANDIPVFFKGNLDKQMALEVAGGWMERFPSPVKAGVALL